MKKIFNLSIIMLVASVLLACDEDPTDALEKIIKEDKGYVPKIARFGLSPVPTGNVTPVVVAAGGDISFDLRYWSEGTIEDIEFWMIQGTTQTKIAELPYMPAYSKVTKTDSLIYTYTVPGTITSTTTFSIQAKVANVGLSAFPAVSSAINFKVQ